MTALLCILVFVVAVMLVSWSMFKTSSECSREEEKEDEEVG